MTQLASLEKFAESAQQVRERPHLLKHFLALKRVDRYCVGN